MADIKIKRRILSACQTNCYYVFRDGCCFVQSPYTGKGFSGTGDLFTSCVTGCLVNGMSLQQSLDKAVAFLQPAIEQSTAENTPGNHGVCFEKYLYLLHR